MDSSSKKLREQQSIILNDTIISISASSQQFVVSCLDDSIYIWDNKFNPFKKQPAVTFTDNDITGIVDIKLTQDSKKLVTLSMDSVIKIWDLSTKQTNRIDVPVMSAWKFVMIDDSIVTCGQLGHIQYYDINTRQSVKKIQAGEIFFTAIAVSSDKGLLAAGNNSGELHIVNLEKKKDKPIAFKPHTKMIRSLAFSQDNTKLLSGSDDSTLKIFDIVSQKVISSYDGHKQSISCVRAHQTDNKIAFTCSFDKSIKIWDLRMKTCIDTFQAGGALWALQVIGRNVVAGGQNGALSVFSIE